MLWVYGQKGDFEPFRIGHLGQWKNTCLNLHNNFADNGRRECYLGKDGWVVTSRTVISRDKLLRVAQSKVTCIASASVIINLKSIDLFNIRFQKCLYAKYFR